MANVLICGNSGFIGRNLLERYETAADVFGWMNYEGIEKSLYLTHQQNKVSGPFKRAYDLLSERDVYNVLHKYRKIDVVVQLAAATSGAKDTIHNPSAQVTNNAIMNSLLLRQAAAVGVKHFIFFSCTTMYPGDQDVVPVKEEDFDPNRIPEKYFGVAWTKVYIEKMCEFYSQTSDMSCTVLRHSNIYGPHDKFFNENSHVMPSLISKVVKADNNTSIELWGDGTETRDFVYIKDLVNLIKIIIDEGPKEKFNLFNVGGGVSYPIREVAEMIIKASGKNLDITIDTSKPTIKTKLVLDNTKIEQAYPKWKRKYSLKEGIGETLSWINERLKI